MTLRTLTLLLATAVAVRPAAGQVVAAPGYAARQIATPDTVQGGVVRRGDAILVGQGAFGAGGQRVVRLDAGGATTIATGFGSLGGMALDATGTLYVTDNGGELAGAATGDTLFAVPDALSRTTPLPALGHEVVPAGSIPFAMDALVLPDGSVLVTDAAGPGAGRVVRLGGSPVSLTTFATGLDFLGGLVLDPAGRVLVANLDASFVGAVLAYAPDGTVLGTVAGGLSGAFSTAVDGDGALLVSGGFTGDFSSSTVIALAPGGGSSERARGFSFAGEMFYDPVRAELLVLDVGVSHIDAICRDRDGDGVCDADDDCPGAADAGQVDTDADGLGDACDPCTGGLPVGRPKLVLGRLGAPAGDETLAFSGRLRLFPSPPALDPVTTGARVRVADAGGLLTDVVIPPGTFVAASGRGWKERHGVFTYVSRAGIQGIRSVRVRPSRKAPGLVRFAVHARRANYAVDAARLPLAATLVLGAAAGQCAEAAFLGPPQPRCIYDPVQAKAKCR